MSVEVSQNIYECEGKYYLDETLNTEIEIVDVELRSQPLEPSVLANSDDVDNINASLVSSPPDHESWTKDETLFLISQMRAYIELTKDAPIVRRNIDQISL